MGSVNTFGELEKNFEDLPTRKFRLRFFCNSIETTLLGQKSCYFSTKSKLVAEKLTGVLPACNTGKHFDTRTWNSWFKGELRRKKKLDQFASLNWANDACAAIDHGPTKEPYLNFLRALDVLAVDLGSTRPARRIKAECARSLILSIHKKWHPTVLGLIKIPIDSLVSEDLIRSRNSWSPDGVVIRAQDVTDNNYRYFVIPESVVKNYDVMSPYSALQFLEMLIINVDEDTCEVFHTLAIDTAACVIAYYCLLRCDDQNVIGDELSRNKIEALDAGLSLFAHPMNKFNIARYLLGVGHPWGKCSDMPDRVVEGRVVAARRNFIHLLLRRGVAPKDFQKIVRGAILDFRAKRNRPRCANLVISAEIRS